MCPLAKLVIRLHLRMFDLPATSLFNCCLSVRGMTNRQDDVLWLEFRLELSRVKGGAQMGGLRPSGCDGYFIAPSNQLVACMWVVVLNASGWLSCRDNYLRVASVKCS
ncbi:hypothetical protein M5D96_001369 [Drosophila gunungcola]|uniref:Uncharacterized protein n=1 Tax=Drosophila gunungcola TaxID=103775 RepID=A0A9P9YXX1_9MUSC|nr:hypothetical protein M5D96_001369 [Drosophila gunungcola]